MVNDGRRIFIIIIINTYILSIKRIQIEKLTVDTLLVFHHVIIEVCDTD